MNIQKSGRQNAHPLHSGSLPQAKAVPVENALPQTEIGCLKDLLTQRAKEPPRLVVDGFRPIIILPVDSPSLVIVERAFLKHNDRQKLTVGEISACAGLCAQATFPHDREGRQLTAKLVRGVLEGKAEPLSRKEQCDFAARFGKSQFPEGAFKEEPSILGTNLAAFLWKDWILEQLSKKEEAVLAGILQQAGNVIDKNPKHPFPDLARANKMASKKAGLPPCDAEEFAGASFQRAEK